MSKYSTPPSFSIFAYIVLLITGITVTVVGLEVAHAIADQIAAEKKINE